MDPISPTPIDPMAAAQAPEARPLALVMTAAMVLLAATLCTLLLVQHWPW